MLDGRKNYLEAEIVKSEGGKKKQGEKTNKMREMNLFWH